MALGYWSVKVLLFSKKNPEYLYTLLDAFTCIRLTGRKASGGLLACIISLNTSTARNNAKETVSDCCAIRLWVWLLLESTVLRGVSPKLDKILHFNLFSQCWSSHRRMPGTFLKTTTFEVYNFFNFFYPAVIQLFCLFSPPPPPFPKLARL